MSLSVGSPTNGWQLRSKRVDSGGALRVKRGTGKATYGHPALVLMLERSARAVARQAPGSVLLVGDLSYKYGGPIAGHRSHESGRDADVGFFVRDRRDRPRNLDRFVAFDAEGKAADGSGRLFDDYRNWLLVQLWLKDHRATIQHVFVASHLRSRLLRYAASHKLFRKYVDDAAALLLQPQNAANHDDHFHVRIRCPKRQRPFCVEHVGVSD
jgi:penicillin-insensitive murein endopeptidase